MITLNVPANEVQNSDPPLCDAVLTTLKSTPPVYYFASDTSIPESVRDLVCNHGFYLHGSRSKIKGAFTASSDWDLTTSPVKFANIGKMDTFLISKGFEPTDMSDEYRDVNFEQLYTKIEKDGSKVTAIIRRNEMMFRYIWDNLTPHMFERFVWKRSIYNKGLSYDEIIEKRHNFMQVLYMQYMGVKEYASFVK